MSLAILRPKSLSAFALALFVFAWGALVAATAKEPDADQKKADKKPADAKSEEKAKEPAFLRLLKDDKKRPLEMQTAIVRYAKPGDDSGLYVDLIAAVHIGDAQYYKRLNEQFEQYDALLYELVAPEGTRVPKKAGRSSHPIGMLQSGLKDILELDYQLEKVDYHKKNFVHADMSPDDMAKSMEDRGETIWSIMFRMMGQGMAQQSKQQASGKSTDAQFLMALFDPNRALALKRAMAQQFEDLEGAMSVFDGPDGSVIITERNKVALEVLKKEIAAGKKKLGIFYGAGHLSDMEKRLETDFGMKRQSVEWISAWDLRDKAKKKS